MPNLQLRVAAWVAFAFLTSSAWSVDLTTPGIEPFSLTPARLLELAAAPAPRDEFAVAFQTEALRYEFDEHHRLTFTSHQIYRIDSVEAVEQYGQIGSEWEPYRQKKPELRARVVTPDGREHQFDPATLSDETIATRDARTFDDLHYLRGPLPAIAPGSVVEVLTIVSDVEPEFPSGNSYVVGIGAHGVVEKTSVTVITPLTSPFSHRMRLLPDAVVSTIERGATREFTLRQGPVALHWEDTYVEAAGDAELWPQLVFSTATSWEEVTNGYRALVEPAIRPEEVRALLPDDLPTEPKQRVAALLRILHERVRYTGVFFGQGDIVPNPPAVTLERRFGDCKDKSVVLASMLRAAGMPAQVALLNSGIGTDIDPDLPGIGGFNHMIVYVPVSEGLWIDATAEYLGAGEVHFANSGRQALLIGPAERPLVRTPEMIPAQNLEFEQRTVNLADIGLGDIDVEARFNGASASTYRQLGDQKSARDSLIEQLRTSYSAKSASGFEVREDPAGDGLIVEIELGTVEAAATSVQEAGIVMSLADMFLGIPYGLRTKEPANASAKEDDIATPNSNPATRTIDWVFQPFVSEVQVKVVPPKGFKLRAVPKGSEKSLGPLVLTQAYREDADGALIGTIRSDSGRGRYSAEEGRTFRDAYFAEESSLMLTVGFDHESWLLARNGQPAAALRRHAELIAVDPRKAIPHVRAAAQLLEFGLVDEAKAQALRATELDPKSAWAFSVLGFVLQHDELGRRFGSGFEREGSILAYREAIRIDPENPDFRLNLAAVAEFNGAGKRYGKGSDLDLAIENYKEVVARRPQWQMGKDLLLAALWQGRKYDEIISTANPAGDSAYAASLLLAAHVMKVGPEAALREDASRTQAASHRARIGGAMVMLWAQRNYDEARALLAAVGTEGTPQDAAIMLDLLQNTARVDDSPEPASTASGTAESLIRLMFRDTVAEKDLAPWTSVKARNHDLDDLLREFESATRYISRGVASRIGEDPAFVRDTVLSNVRFQEAPFTKSSTRVTITLGGTRVGAFYLVPENSDWKLLAMFPYAPAIAREALRLLDAGDSADASEWVLAVKTEIHADSNSEFGPYRNFLAALPNADAYDDPVALRLATLALLVVNSPETVKDGELQRAADGLETDIQREILESVRFAVARETGDGELAVAAAEGFNRLKPDSADGLRMRAQSYEIARQWEHAERASRNWMAQRPGDIGAKQALARALNGQSRFAEALETWAPEVRQGTADPSQLNNYAWQALVAGSIDSMAVKAAENSHQQRQRRNYSSAHTLACVYAEQGRVVEARRVLLQILADDPTVDPFDEDIWLVRGLIAEVLGETKSAMTSYRKIEKPNQFRADSVYAIATARLAKLAGDGATLSAR